MSRTKNVLTFVVGVVLGVFVVLSMTGVEATEYRLDTGDHRNLEIILDQHASLIDNLRSEVVELAAKLDADGGVTDADYESGLAAGTSAVTSTNVAHTARGH